jgi:hypothetical protein
LDALQQDFRLGDAEFAGTSVPEDRRRGIALNRTQLNPLEKVRIVGLPNRSAASPLRASAARS